MDQFQLAQYPNFCATLNWSIVLLVGWIKSVLLSTFCNYRKLQDVIRCMEKNCSTRLVGWTLITKMRLVCSLLLIWQRYHEKPRSLECSLEWSRPVVKVVMHWNFSYVHVACLKFSCEFVLLKTINTALANRVKNRITFKGHLNTYRFCDNVWTFVLEDVDFREMQETIKVDKVKIVACDGKSGTGTHDWWGDLRCVEDVYLPPCCCVCVVTCTFLEHMVWIFLVVVTKTCNERKKKPPEG